MDPTVVLLLLSQVFGDLRNTAYGVAFIALMMLGKELYQSRYEVLYWFVSRGHYSRTFEMRLDVDTDKMAAHAINRWLIDKGYVKHGMHMYAGPSSTVSSRYAHYDTRIVHDYNGMQKITVERGSEIADIMLPTTVRFSDRHAKSQQTIIYTHLRRDTNSSVHVIRLLATSLTILDAFVDTCLAHANRSTCMNDAIEKYHYNDRREYWTSSVIPFCNVGFEHLFWPEQQKVILMRACDDLKSGFASNRLTPRKRTMLLSGAPGLGKTFAAQLCAKVAGVPLYYMPPLDSVDGKVTKDTAQVFVNKILAITAPCVLLGDEIDLLMTVGDDAVKGAHSEVQIRQLLDGTLVPGILIVLTTNNPEALIKNAPLYSRIDHHLELTVPDERIMTDILQDYGCDLTCTKAPAEEGTNPIDMRKLFGLLERDADPDEAKARLMLERAGYKVTSATIRK